MRVAQTSRTLHKSSVRLALSMSVIGDLSSLMTGGSVPAYDGKGMLAEAWDRVEGC